MTPNIKVTSKRVSKAFPPIALTQSPASPIPEDIEESLLHGTQAEVSQQHRPISPLLEIIEKEEMEIDLEKESEGKDDDEEEAPPQQESPGQGKGQKTLATTQRRKIKKPHRFRPGTRALIEIRQNQKESELIFAKLPFARLVREVMQDLGTIKPGDSARNAANIGLNTAGMMFQGSAILAIQTAAEAYLIEVFEKTNDCAITSGLMGIQPKHMKLAMRNMGDKEKEGMVKLS